MTRLSATATSAALLLLAIAQGFGATKVTAKVATKDTAKPYHITAQNQFHMSPTKTAKASKWLTQMQTRHDARLKSKQDFRAQHGLKNLQDLPPIHDPLSATHNRPASAMARGMKPRRNQSNPPPTGTLGFVSATQVATGGGGPQQVLEGTWGGSTGFVTVVDVYTPACPTCTPATTAFFTWNYSVVLNNAGTFSAPALTPVVNPYVSPYGSGNEYPNAFVVGDVNGDGNTDIVQVDQSGGVLTVTVLAGSATGTFTPVTTGKGNPSPFTLADANGARGGTLVMNAASGFLDIAVVDDEWSHSAGVTPSNLTTYAGNGDGTFGAALASPVVPVATSSSSPLLAPTGFDGDGNNVILADFDGDGTLDVAENDYTDGQLVVYLSSTTPNPYAGTAYTTPDGDEDACTATSGSLTGSSGLPAIVDVFCDEGKVAVYIQGSSAGSFNTAVYYASAGVVPNADTFPYGATIAVTSTSTNADLVLTNEDSGDITVLLGNGDGTLNTTNVGYGVGGFPYSPAIVTDINGDGLADILVADEEFSLTWMAGFGDGTFQAARDYYSPLPGNGNAESYSIATGDFNGDGFPDVVTGNFGDNLTGITVFLSNPDGSLGQGTNYGTSGNLGEVAVADFNGDGFLDIAATDEQGSVDIFFGTGNGSFIEGPSYGVGGAGLFGIVAANFGSDTSPDMAVVNESSSTLTILTNDGAGGFGAGVPIPLNGEGYAIATADINGDGFPDLAISEYNNASSSGQVGLLLWDAAASAFATAAVPEYDIVTGVNVYPELVALAPINGDTIPDLIATVEGSTQGIFVALNATTAKATTATFTPLAVGVLPASLQNVAWDSPEPYGLQVTDVNGDGVPDLVYSNIEFGTVGVLFGSGTGTNGATPTAYFYDPVEFPSAESAFALTTANLNGDGSPGAQASSVNFAGASTLINANGTAAAPNFSLAVSGQSSPAFLNIADGGTATAMITLTPINFYSGTVTFSCGGLPLDVTCAFAPATLTPAGNAPLSTTVTITTAAPHGALRMPADANPNQGRTSLLACLTGMGLFGLLLSGDWKNKRNRRVGILLGILVLGMMFSLVGCSSSSTPGTPIGAQTIQVTGTGSDGTTNAVSLTINVF
jgi:hypothetical protein